MTNLNELKQTANIAGEAFERACLAHYPNGRWDFYKALDRGEKVPTEIVRASDDYLAAVHAYYEARDGRKGFLGSRGL